jgi:hypothetical protein
MVAGLQQQQAITTATLTRLDNTVRTISGANGRRRNAAEEGNPKFPTIHKVEFPKYDGSIGAIATSRCAAHRSTRRSSTRCCISSTTPNYGTTVWSSTMALPTGPASSSSSKSASGRHSRTTQSRSWPCSGAPARWTTTANNSWPYLAVIRRSRRSTKFSCS